MDTPQNGSTAGHKDAADENDASKRGRSKIAFVYSDLEGAVDLARTIQTRTGMTCEIKQLATWMNQSAEGGTFRSLLGAARSFGLVETQQGNVTLTTLGLNALNEHTRPHALSEAFLKVPLHSAMYQQFQTHALPPPAAIERHFESLGVPPKQKERARQTFVKSAQFAGFIDPSSGRFIRPATPAPATGFQAPPENPKGGGGGEGDGLNLDPLLIELLRKIPPKENGWPGEQRARWFRTFAMNVSQIYDEEGKEVDLAIKLDSLKEMLK